MIVAHDDDNKSWYSGSNLSDGDGKMASLAAAFGGIFTEMQEQAQERRSCRGIRWCSIGDCRQLSGKHSSICCSALPLLPWIHFKIHGFSACNILMPFI